ncbi:hypothetical protein COX69_02830 [Candidatus Falkowbacteria bacterium CG_4_10_14_0_2_um_filter_48_10]|uniref:DUF2304 domain-containing protein n=1 Tax=Candidatus Falkowbacteria bacterium CG23_combo_of_CG06-09_8_20_14_all_49_15 TaxID=1974572 RepID=A0A2G9ZJQ5_9BACT|nr:MAG: hypothetical protein COX22_04495 [Candidatus Falkowbacteria bacterium CG23_combo_of_CG06-09_8_20_14_all_49_15]PJA08218.1 MAG: hypothetical protein COX69_02830 [Candidatus Falkowbacteria bacterium CG_4_10_14_0_2_um_filter_48_10]
MGQQAIALLFILFFITRLILQKRRGALSGPAFVFWLSFWLIAGLLVVFIRSIDRIVSAAGFSSSGINVLLYLAVAWLFYLSVKLNIKISVLDKNITILTRALSERRGPDEPKPDL